jgi:hypothetical protein
MPYITCTLGIFTSSLGCRCALCCGCDIVDCRGRCLLASGQGCKESDGKESRTLKRCRSFSRIFLVAGTSLTTLANFLTCTASTPFFLKFKFKFKIEIKVKFEVELKFKCSLIQA